MSVHPWLKNTTELCVRMYVGMSMVCMCLCIYIWHVIMLIDIILVYVCVCSVTAGDNAEHGWLSRLVTQVSCALIYCTAYTVLFKWLNFQKSCLSDILKTVFSKGSRDLASCHCYSLIWKYAKLILCFMAPAGSLFSNLKLWSIINVMWWKYSWRGLQSIVWVAKYL